MGFKVPEKYRLKNYSQKSDGNNGVFAVRTSVSSPVFTVIASDGFGWDHVSVSLPNRCPSWEEMCKIKDLFWDAEDCVLQYHPPLSTYVNNHPYCLHLWRPTEHGEIPFPPQWMVGIKND